MKLLRKVGARRLECVKLVSLSPEANKSILDMLDVEVVGLVNHYF